MYIKQLCLASILVVISLIVQVTSEQTTLEPPYTEDITQFKNKKYYNARSEKLLACWLYLRQQTQKDLNQQLNDQQWLYLMKKCMKNIKRKTAVLKITQLGKRNLEPVHPFTTILSMQQQLLKVNNSGQKTQFDEFLLARSKQFTHQLSQIFQKGNIQNQIEEQLKKREKYYFGIIPASMFTHTTILITISMVMMCCCTWFKFYKASADKKRDKENLKQNNQENYKQQSIRRMKEVAMRNIYHRNVKKGN